jgi:hypothetical protein
MIVRLYIWRLDEAMNDADDDVVEDGEKEGFSFARAFRVLTATIPHRRCLMTSSH